ncbi:MAG: 30S ribosomal protein S20 [Caldiserica bacterium]|jgi:small subunit ribosomal protein S20|nr:30S ribosomal protein S20 [Caldisericota bacterium]NCO28253.1 30S ribosomal protein S20 [Caldisericota bacterium]PIP49316.1 MAG: 30S ribosomal protein S20 [Caldiserica bacterium CG23_combo_of_CG06-09_8_20_14_all_35_60]
MPILKASIKSVRKDKKRRERNDYFRGALNKAMDFARKSNYSEEKVKEAIKLVDKLEAKGIIHKNTAARKKSSLMKKLNASEQ